MKNILGIIALVCTSLVVAGGDVNDKSAAHAVALIETMGQAYNVPTIVSLKEKSEAQTELDEARKNCQLCLLIEFIKRAPAISSRVKVSYKTNENASDWNKFYAKNCPANIY